MKIYIIGPSGSGKTTIAKKISEKLEISHTDLDDIFWDNSANSFGIKRDENIRTNMYKDILKKDKWIIEGAYLVWPFEGFNKADVLIFLNIKKSLLTYRIVKRFVKRKLCLDNNKKKETIKGLLELIKWNKKQYAKMNMFFTREKSKYPALVCLSNKSEIKSFINKIDPNEILSLIENI